MGLEIFWRGGVGEIRLRVSGFTELVEFVYTYTLFLGDWSFVGYSILLTVQKPIINDSVRVISLHRALPVVYSFRREKNSQKYSLEHVFQERWQDGPPIGRTPVIHLAQFSIVI